MAALPLFVTGCGGGGSSSSPPQTGVTPPLVPAGPSLPPLPSGAIRTAYAGQFAVGAALKPSEVISGSEAAALVADQFSSVTAENIMKPEALAPTPGNYNFGQADEMVDFAVANGMEVRGHTLLWHRATPDYFFEGTPAEVRARLETYIFDVVTHFKDRVQHWDVVNEVVADGGGGTAPYRDSNWYRAAGGPNYIDWAFNAARAADPNAKLFINEYSTEFAGKRDRMLGVVQDLLARGIPIDGVGHQMHINRTLSAQNAFDALQAVDNLFAGLVNHITELDISIYSDPGSCFVNGTGCADDIGDALPASWRRQQAQLYRDLFNGFLTFPSLLSVSLWGLTDDGSWLNTWPVTRTNYPLLFDRDGAPKPAAFAITDPTYEIQ